MGTSASGSGRVRARVTRADRIASAGAGVTGLSPNKLARVKILDSGGREKSVTERRLDVVDVATSIPIPIGLGATAARVVVPVAAKVAARKLAKEGVEKAAEKVVKKTVKQRVKGAVKSAPTKAIKKARRTGRAVATKEGRRRVGKAAAKASVRAARRNPAIATGAYALAADEAGVGGPLVEKVAADTRGVIDAVNSFGDIAKTGKTTLRAVPGILAGIGATGLAAGISGGRLASDNLDRATGGLVGKDYSPKQIASPLVEEALANAEGTVAIAKPFVEGDQAGVTDVVQNELGFLPVVATPRFISATRNSRLAQGVRQTARGRASTKRAAKNEKIRTEGEGQQKNLGQRGTGGKKLKSSPPDTRFGGEYVMPRVGRIIEGTRQRGERSREAARAKAKADVQTARILRPVEKLIQKVAVPRGRDAKEYRGGAKNAIASILNYGIPRNYEAAVKWMDDIERGIAMPDNPPKISDRGAFKFLRDNPEIFKDKDFWAARDILWREQDSITTSEVKRYLGAGGALGIKNPDERLAEGVWVGGEPRTVRREKTVDEPVGPEEVSAAAAALARRERRDRRRAGIAGRRTERRRATRQSKNYDATPDAINQREWYQGGATKGLNPRDLDPDETQASNLFGMGIYLTTSPKVARGYGKARTNKGQRGRPQLYRARVQVKNPLDLDAPLDSRFRDTLIAFAERIERDDFLGELSDGLVDGVRRVAESKNTTNADLYTALRNEVGAVSQRESIPSYEFSDYFSDLRADLVSQGWDALTHRGGKRTGGRDHQTLILLDPNPSSVRRFDTRGNRPIGPEPRPVSRVPRTRKGKRVQKEVVAEGTLVTRERGRKEDTDLQRQMAELKNLRAELRRARKSGDTDEADRLAPIVDRKEKALKDITQATKKAQADFVSETRAAMAERGLETPAYVRSWADREMLDQAAPFPASGVLSQRNWIDRDTARKSGEVERAWDDFVRNSIYKPRAQRIYHDLVSEFAANNAIRLKSGRGSSTFFTMAEISDALRRGEINPKDYVAFHSQHFRSAVQDPSKIDPESGIGAFFQLDEKGRGDLAKLDAEIRLRAADRGNKYIVVPRPGAEELVKQFQGQNKWGKAANINRLGSRLVLGYNPSWLIAQFVAEGIPAAVAVGLNPARLRRMRRATRERATKPEFADIFDSTAGQTAGTTVIPKRDRGLDTRGRDITTSAPLTKPEKFGQEILSALKGEALGRVDRAKGGGFRKMVLAAQIDREVNGFLGGLGGFLKLDGEVKRGLKEMTPAEQQAYLLRNPKTAKALEGYLDDVMGNWRAISSKEEMAASLVAFYPYVRYAIKTAFWGFPKRHPIKSSILYFFGQLNANELEDLVGNGTPVEWINYAYPVVSVDGGQRVVPGAARIAPALSVVAESIGTNNLGRLFGGLSPLLGAGYTAVTGTDFTGQNVAQSIPESLLMGLAALTSMIAPYRAASSQYDPEGNTPPFLRSYSPRRGYDETGPTTIIGGRSTTSKYLGKRDVDKGWMSLFNPFQTISAQDFKERQQVIDALNRGARSELPGSAASKSSSSSNSSSSSSSSSGGFDGWQTLSPSGKKSKPQSGGTSTGGGFDGWRTLSP